MSPYLRDLLGGAKHPKSQKGALRRIDMKLKKTITVLAAAFALTIGGASAAAVADPYVPSGGAAGPTTVAPGGTATFGWAGFEPGETVSFTLTGESASSATLAALAAVETKTLVKNADSAGNGSVTVTLPANATGTYTLTATAESGTASTQFAAGVAATGADVSPVLIWGAVGAVGLGVIALISVSAVRRNREAEVLEHV